MPSRFTRLQFQATKVQENSACTWQQSWFVDFLLRNTTLWVERELILILSQGYKMWVSICLL